MTDKIADALRRRADTMNGARPVGAGDGQTYTVGYYDSLARKVDVLAADALDAKDKRIAELEAALDDALDTILEHILADSSPVTKEDQPAIEAFDRAVEEGRARLASSLLNKEDRNG